MPAKRGKQKLHRATPDQTDDGAIHRGVPKDQLLALVGRLAQNRQHGTKHYFDGARFTLSRFRDDHQEK